MKPAAEIALLGTFAFVVPALITLPSKLAFNAREVASDRVTFNRLRVWVIILGILTGLLSLISPFFYLLLLRSTNGKTSDGILPVNAHCCLIWLYVSTAALLGCFGVFYFIHKRALNLHSAISA